MNNQECKIRPVVMNINCNETLFYPHNILANECSGSCNNIDNNINNFHAKLCVVDVVKNMNINVCNQILRTNETRYVSWHETCNCKCRLDVSVCNNKEHWNKDKRRCECKKLIDKERWDERFIWNPSKCECGCDKSCDCRQYLDYESCKCRKKIDKLVEECTGNTDENEFIYNTTLNNYGNVCNSGTYA